MSRKIVALAGEAGVGKDTFADPLVKAGWVRGSFAANLKEMCQTIFNLPPFLTDTQEGKMKRLDVPRVLTEANMREIIRWVSRTHDVSACNQTISKLKKQYIFDKTTTFYTSREILQFVGTEICRRLTTTYHVDVLFMKIEQSETNWVITDARFPNERKMLKDSFNATLIRLKRPGFTGFTGGHASENSFGEDDEYDVVFNNDGDIAKLHAEARRYF